MTIEISNEDATFLDNLKQELNTQPNDGNVDPVFWVVQQRERTWGFEEGYGTDAMLVDFSEGDEIGRTPQECIEWFTSMGWFEEDEYATLTKSDFEHCDDLHDILEILDEKRPHHGYGICRYSEDYNIVPDTLFLTKRECQEHIERNKHHYKDPSPYAMTAWRSPQVKQLLGILKTVQWTI